MSEVKGDVRTKVETYVKANYKNFKDKELIITEDESLYVVKHHINGSPLFLGKTIV